MWSSGFVFLIFILFSFYVSTRDRTLFDIKLQNAKRDEKALNDANITPTSPEWVDMIYSFCDKAKKLNEDGMSVTAFPSEPKVAGAVLEPCSAAAGDQLRGSAAYSSEAPDTSSSHLLLRHRQLKEILPTRAHKDG